MPNQDQDNTLQEIMKRLKDEFHPEKAYLFGSRARGDNAPDSDYDLLLVVEDSSVGRLDRMEQASEVLHDLEASVNVFVYTRKEFEEWKDEFSSIPETALREGREILIEAK